MAVSRFTLDQPHIFNIIPHWKNRGSRVRLGISLAGNRHVFFALLAGVLTVALHAQAPAPRTGALRTGFVQPPAAAKLRCYWWWLNGNTTADAITRDLEGMKAKGIGGAILVDADGSGQQGNQEVANGPAMGSPRWMALFVHALAEAKRLGLEISLNVTSRWDVGIIGGQTVTPEDAIKLLSWSRTTVNGSGSTMVRLTAPRVVNGFYRPIATLAYPLRRGAAMPGAQGSDRSAILDLEFKTASAETGFSMPPSEQVLRNGKAVAGEQDADVSEVVDLSEHVDANGNLEWNFPAGQWEVLRIGYTDTGKQLTDAAGHGLGLPLDVLSAESFDHYWQQVVTPMLEAARPYIGSSLRYLVTDSWEAGGLNWTANFREEFKQRRGYDPVAYLPIVTGRILTSREASNQFLFDLRRTVADLITVNYYDRFADAAKKNGLGTHPESGGPHGAPIDALETFRNSSFPQTEYWADSGWHRVADVERFYVKEASSAAHIYGKPFVAAEGPTSMNLAAWSESLSTNVQPAIDYAFTEGLNRLFWHEFTSSPVEYGKPGQEYFAGTHLNPNVTWWQQAGPFLLALNRAQFLLQQGQPVSDLLYFYGDQVPGFVRPKNDDPAHLLPGYDYDVVNEDALLHRMKFDGAALRTPEGIGYRALALPANGRLSVAALKWVEQFVAQGGTVIGLKPSTPLGLTAPAALAEYKHVADALWAGCTSGAGTAVYQKGAVLCTSNARNGFAALGLAPDFTYQANVADPHPVETPVFDFVHRTASGSEIYFVRNTQPHSVQATLSFRVEGRSPELWSAEDGSMVPVEIYRTSSDHHTEIPLAFPAYGSVFVVFDHPAGKHLLRVEREGAAVYPSIRQGTELFYGSHGLGATAPGAYLANDSAGQQHRATVAVVRDMAESAHWTLQFPSGWGAPASVPLTAFQSWSLSTDPGVRYFSGTATYRTTLQLPSSAAAQQLWLQLGEVREIATVRINGKDAGTVWRAPYAVRVDGLLHAGTNTVEISVANLWPNRLIGDQQPGVVRRYAQTNSRAYKASSPLLPSGILLPVVLAAGIPLDWSN